MYIGRETWLPIRSHTLQFGCADDCRLGHTYQNFGLRKSLRYLFKTFWNFFSNKWRKGAEPCAIDADKAR